MTSVSIVDNGVLMVLIFGVSSCTYQSTSLYEMFVPHLRLIVYQLIHLLGHGPFSHMFDGVFIPAVMPGSKWHVCVCVYIMMKRYSLTDCSTRSPQ